MPIPTANLLLLFIPLLTISFLTLSVAARPYVLVLSQEDFKDDVPPDSDSSAEWDEFGDSDSHKSEEDLDPGSWRQIFEPSPTDPQPQSDTELLYYSSVSKLMTGDSRLMEEGSGEIEAAAESGYPAAQSVLGFLWGMGLLRERSKQKAFVYHHFASEGGNMQSKMALAYLYTRQDMFDKSVKLYAELAEVAVNSFLISKDSPVIEPVRLHNGAEENKEALRKSKGEEDDDFQILEYQAQKGNAAAMYKVGLFYYFGLRGLRRDHSKALSWFLKAVEKGEPRSMELLGEIYARGAGVERNYTKAFEWLTLASKHHLYSAYNGIGYLYVKGYGVDSKNYTKAKEYFEKAADNDEVGGHYNLGVMYLKGIGVKRDVKLACKFFIVAANHGQPKAFYQLAKIFHLGVGFKKNVPLDPIGKGPKIRKAYTRREKSECMSWQRANAKKRATALYKLVAERGPWSSLSRWALEAYLKGDVGKAYMLYSRMAEMGYEGTARDYDRAAEAYMHAKSQSNAQAMFNLGYMHEHGQGLPLDLHLAKRYYDEALEHDPAAKLPVTLALTSLWVRKNHADSLLVHIIDSLPDVYPKLEAWVENVLLEEGNATILTLFACLLTVLYLRERQRRQAVAVAGEVAQPNRPNELGVAAPM
ncbi:hypothetical protein TSUD_72800 [Trifolium subterraneum]|uniref:DOD-type homing endonuclease domain-containing protein n=1 Tax=Trifolium subterraneum TaxID=3900 RepID=A0A2Z6LGU8_TRISU|nr:hypothetical protein TSUD_72800 [Trifolium subterraneum]